MTVAARTAVWAKAWPGLAGFDLTLDPADDMLAGSVAEIGDLDQAVVAYLRSGLEVAGVWQRLLAQDQPARTGSRDLGLQNHAQQNHGLRVLDFASGYGRVTRFLAPSLPGLEVADIDAAAVARQTEQFGVAAFVAPTDPADLSHSARGPARPFDWILVTSLFTHLPWEATRSWLQALTGVLAPDGILALTYHNIGLLGTSGDLSNTSSGDFVFTPSSESRVLSPQSYGSTWISRDCLADLLHQAVPGIHTSFHPRVFGERHDLVLASRDPRVRDLQPRRAPFGYFERAVVDPTAVELAGWALDLGTGEALATIEVWVDGARADAVLSQQSRCDVTARYGEATDQPVAYRLRFARPQLDTAAVVLVGHTREGVEGVLEARSLDGYRLRHAQLELAQERDEVRFWRGRFAEVESAHVARGLALASAQAALDAVAASRFWQARRAWFALKRRLGLPAIE
jgi:SAM-dependent methyltransferase